MASMLDSFKDIFNDKHSFLKVLIFSIAVFYDYSLYLNYKNDPISFNFVTTLIIFFLFGFIIEITNNIINERTNVLPSLNPIKLMISSVKGILAILPAILISCYLANTVCTMLNTIEWFDYTVKTIAWLLAITIIISSYLLFAVNKKIPEAFKLWVIFDKFGDLIFSIIFLILQLALINVVVLGFIIYTIMILFGPGPILNFIISLAVVYDICAIAHFIGQIHYENIQYHKD